MTFPAFEELEPLLDASNPVAVAALQERYPFYPLTSEGMPMPGTDFVREAYLLGDTACRVSAGKKSEQRLMECGRRLAYLYLRALYDPYFTLSCQFRGNTVVTPLLGGHKLGERPCGPKRSRIMLIGKNPGSTELREGVNFVGIASDPFWRVLPDLDISEAEAASWYVTNLVRHEKLDPSSDRVSATHVKNCLPLLHQELRLVRPDFLCCFGSEAAIDLLGKGHGVGDMYGRVVDYQIPIHFPGEEPAYHPCKVMVCLHPAAVYHAPHRQEEFKDAFNLFWRLSQGDKIGEVETDIEHIVISDVETLEKHVDKLIAEGQTDFAIDAEWHGDAPTEPGAYLRTIQISGKAKTAFVVNLREAGGAVAFRPSLKAALPALRRLCKRTSDRHTTVGGHFLRADMPWLLHYGLDVRLEYAPAETWEEQRAGKGGWDTSLMLHALYETGPFGLEYHTSRLCGIPRYDLPLERWKRAYCHEHKLEPKDMEGYGDCPAIILHPYGAYDADGTLRVKQRCVELLDRDSFGLNNWRAFWQAHRGSLGFLEMEMWGVDADLKQADLLTDDYMLALKDRLAAFRTAINWPEFNPNSTIDTRELLFGEHLNGAKPLAPGQPRIKRPPGAICLGVDPVKTTGKPPKDWAKVVSWGEEALYNPSTDRESLGILLNTYHDHRGDLIKDFRDLRYLGQILRQVLRPPEETKEGDRILDDDGNYTYQRALVSWRRKCNRIHTFLSQVKETGRASSARPPLQNISKRREDDYKRIQGDRYRAPMRSILRAQPGWILVEADIQSAELAVLAWMSGDKQFIEDVNRNMLHKGHPNRLDLHAHRAVTAFHLDCEPTEAALEALGRAGLRIAAKNVNFGVPYGRGADAIARQCREEGVNVSIDEAQALIDAYYARYPDAEAFLKECADRSMTPGWVEGAFGRHRRFYPTDDRKVQGDAARQACNFPIQNCVADYISEAIWQIQCYREEIQLPFRIVLQIHDALLFEVREEHAARLVNDVIPECMTRRVAIYPTRLDGTRRPEGPYNFGVDVGCYRNWGIKMKEAELKALGL